MERHIDLCHDGIGEYTTFTEYLSGRHAGLYGPSSMPPSKSQSKSIDYVKIYQEEAIRELARQKIKALSVPRQEQQHLPISQSRQTQPQQQSHTNSIQSLTPVDPSEIFGYRAKSCRNCGEIVLGIVYFDNETNDGEEEEEEHACNGNFQHYFQSDMSEEMEAKILTSTIKQGAEFDSWIGKHPSYLNTTRLSDPKADEVVVERPGEQNKKTLTIKCSERNQIELDLTKQEPNHWAARAIRDNNPIVLDPHEFDEFLNVVRNATYGVFKVHNESKTEFYFMAVSTFPVRVITRTNKEDHSNEFQTGRLTTDANTIEVNTEEKK
jgi:hypothetical protein